MSRYLKFLLFFFVVSLLLFGCSNEEELPKPEDRLSEYIEEWKQLNFESMYKQLSTETQRKFNEDDFTSRYETIYSAIRANNVTIHVEEKEDQTEERVQGQMDEDGEPLELQFMVRVEMETIAGDISFTHPISVVKEELNIPGDDRKVDFEWRVQWEPQLIFPQLEEGDLVRVSTQPASRGEIFDRNGQGLAINGTITAVGVVPERLGESKEASIKALSEALNVTTDYIEQQLNQSWVQPHFFVPLASFSNDDTETIEKLLTIPGVTYQKQDSRVYPYKSVVGHLTGYIQNITAEELEERRDEGYTAQDVIGKTGLERLYEEKLKGKNGAVIYTTDSEGNRKETVAEKQPQHGEDIYLTIDITLQQLIYDQMEGDTGTSVAIHPMTGDVLALVNRPAFDPNAFVLGLSNAEWEELNNDPDKPLLNRFTHTYSPGSTFKHLTAAIGLEEGEIDPLQKEDIVGYTWQPSTDWGNFQIRRVTDPEQPINLVDALAYSDNIYFAKAALEIDNERFVDRLSAFGFDTDIPFEYPISQSQVSNSGEIDSDILLADSGYGQGQILMSPLHLALTYTPLLNEGYMVQPVLFLNETNEQRWLEQVMSNDTIEHIISGLKAAVESSYGTAQAARIDGHTIAGKTGTAELKQSFDDETGKENGWFVAFNVDEPSLIIVMMIEDVKENRGSQYVVPKVKNVLQSYLD